MNAAPLASLSCLDCPFGHWEGSVRLLAVFL